MFGIRTAPSVTASAAALSLLISGGKYVVFPQQLCGLGTLSSFIYLASVSLCVLRLTFPPCGTPTMLR